MKTNKILKKRDHNRLQLLSINLNMKNKKNKRMKVINAMKTDSLLQKMKWLEEEQINNKRNLLGNQMNLLYKKRIMILIFRDSKIQITLVKQKLLKCLMMILEN